ncbi:hypothetical protein J2W24_002055 [Variovorax boronicumulans]|uniref:hypothetical protein n=1 Tax=Variovorax boronicumulans TaxID=436515 RepID=UPI0027844BA3|nr:hypothetical protein [Variovorax boronicumulans]MDP9916410.1 hypothetical protein [Variovorax boronicumulans]
MKSWGGKLIYVFYLEAIAFSVYFVKLRKKIDYFTVAHFSALIYFIPGFFGYTSYESRGSWSDTPMHSEVYAIMMMVLLSIFLFSFFYSERKRKSENLQKIKNGRALEVKLFFLIAVVGVALFLLEVGMGFANPEKDEVLEDLGRGHIIFYSAAMLGLPLAVAMRMKVMGGILFSLLLFNVYIGFRSNFAVSMIAVGVWYCGVHRDLVVRNIGKVSFLLLSFGLFMFLYKTIAYAVKAGMWELVSDRLFDSETYFYMIANSEPFITQSILNEVVGRGFQTSWDHIYSSVYQLLFFSSSLGASAISFNDRFQFELFGNVGYGMGSNIWAQMWSAGGWPLLLLMICLFNLILIFGNKTLKSRDAMFSAGLAPIFSYWAFYIHRNDLSYMLGLSKRLLVVWILCAILSRIMRRRPLIAS